MIKKLIEQRNRLLSEVRTLMGDGSNVSVETRTKVDAMLADAQALKGDIERIQSAAESNEIDLPEHRNALPRGGVESADVDNRSQEERNAATNVALRSYLRGERFEQRDLTIAADGGVMLPVGALPPVSATKFAGSIYDLVFKLRTATGEDIRQPLWDDTANELVLDSTAIGAGTDPSRTGVTIKTDGLRTGDPLLIDNKLIQDATFDLVGYTQQMLQDRYTRGVSKLISQGNASNFSSLVTAAPVGVTAASATAVVYDELDALVTSLDPSYSSGAAFSMTNATLSVVRRIKDTAGRPIFLAFNDGAVSGFAGTILGYPVKLNQYAPAATAGNKAILFGDHSKAFTLREVLPGLVIKRSTERWIELNRTGLVGFARAGGAPTLANNTTYSPIQALAMKAS